MVEFHLLSIEVFFGKLFLFGTTEDKKSVCYEVEGFQGYFYLNIGNDSANDVVEALNLQKYEICEKKRLIGFTFDQDRLLKIYYKNDFEKKNIEQLVNDGLSIQCENKVYEICNNDWTMDKLFLFEEGLSLQSWLRCPTIQNYELKKKVTYKKGLFQFVSEKQGHISSIMSLTSRKNYIGAQFENEEPIIFSQISDFKKYFEQRNPDCLLYCSDQSHTIQVIDEQCSLDRYPSKKFGRFKTNGRVLYDILHDIKKMTGIKLDGFTMEDIVENEDIVTLKNGLSLQKQDKSKFIEENEKWIQKVCMRHQGDEKQAMLIELEFLKNFEENRNGLIQFMEISQLCYCDLNDCISGGQQVRIFSLLQKTCFDNNRFINKNMLNKPCVYVSHEDNSFQEPSIGPNILPMHERKDSLEIPHEKKKKKEFRKYQGGYVRDPIPQLYNKDYTATCDFSSLYPSIIIGYQLCYSTILYDYELLKNPSLKFLYVPVNESQCVVYVVSVSDQKNDGIVPLFLKKCLERRKNIKSLMKNATGAEYSLRDAQQLAAKVTCNATYGFLDVRKNGILPLPALRISVCSIGQWMNIFTGEFFKKHYQMGIVYGDTDSVMVQTRIKICEDDDPEKLKKYWKFYEDCAKEVSKSFPAPNSLTMESIKSPFLLNPEKKTYAAITCISLVPLKFKTDIKGFSFSKRDRCIWVRNTGSFVIDLILSGRINEIEPYLKQQLQVFIDKKVKKEDLLISCSVSDDYKNEDSKLIQKEVRKKIESQTGKKLVDGSRLSYIVVHGKEPFYLRGEPISTTKKLDYKYYLEKQFYPPIKCVLTCITSVNLDKIMKPFFQKADQMNQGVQDISSFFGVKKQKIF